MTRLTILFVVFALATLHGYGQAQKAKHSKNTKQPTAPVAETLIKENNGENLQPKSTQHVDADVRVVQTPKKDGYDLAAFWVTFFLGIIGIAGVVVGICTLLTIRKQTLELAIQNRNMVGKERARIAVTFDDESNEMTVKHDAPTYVGTVKINIKNIGNTVALDIQGSYDAFACAKEFAPKSEDMFRLFGPDFVEGNSWQQASPLTIDNRLSGNAPAVFYVFVRVLISYSDIFNSSRNTFKGLSRREFIQTRDGYAESKVFWESVGNEEDNKST